MAVKALTVIAIGRVVSSPPVMPLSLLSVILKLSPCVAVTSIAKSGRSAYSTRWTVPEHISLDV